MNSKSQVTCHDIEGNLYQVLVNELSFRPAIYGVVVKDGQVLLSKQWDGYDFPGGAIELGETLEEALVREVKEETGLEVKVVEPNYPLYAQDSFFKMPFKGNYIHAVHLYYLCEVIGGKLSTDFFDEQEKKYAAMPEWIKLNDLTRQNFCSSVEIEKLVTALNKVY